MDYQMLFNLVAGPGLLALGWFSRQVWQDVKDVTKALGELRVEIATNYVPRNDFKEFSAEIREMFNKVMDKLDNKADK
jgi:hypothetical protein